jgi:hypothetical protein
MSDESPNSLISFKNLINLDIEARKPSFKKISSDTILNLAGEAVCYNQKMLAQYYSLLGQKHKALKDESKKDSHNQETLRKLYNDLDEYAYNTLRSIAVSNFSYIIRYFQERNVSVKPRVCLKLISGDLIITAFRDNPSILLDNKDYNKTENTAFERICRGESEYLCNNIPEKSKSNEYVNARITDKAMLDKYREYNILNNFLGRMPGLKIHTNWNNCWEKPNIHPSRKDLNALPPEACYKSTLVIPLALNRSDLEKEFLDQFDSMRDDQKTQRIIFGFLCFDHQSINFFNTAADKKIGYIFADILSLYLIARKTYTECSTTFKKMTLEFNA